MAAQKQDDQHERTFISYVKIQVVVLKTCLGRWTIGRSGERGSGISVLPAWYDDDDDDVAITKQCSTMTRLLAVPENLLNNPPLLNVCVYFFMNFMNLLRFFERGRFFLRLFFIHIFRSLRIRSSSGIYFTVLERRCLLFLNYRPSKYKVISTLLDFRDHAETGDLNMI